MSDAADDNLYAYALSDFSRDSGKDIDLASGNTAPRGIWSDGKTIWVLDKGRKKLYAYVLADGSRRAGQELTLDSAGENYNSIWSDGETMYVIENAAGSATRDPRIHKLPLLGAVLVSNAEQTALGTLSTGSGTGTQAFAQAFSTGSNHQGYTIDAVEVLSGGSNAFSVDIHHTNASRNHAPITLSATLTSAGDFTAGGTASFTAPADTVLEPNTTYTLLMTPDSGAVSIWLTNSNAEDSTSLAGWTIRNGHHNLPNNGPWQASSAQAFIVTVRGTRNPDTVPAAITDLRASAGDAEVDLSWGLPDHGGAPLTKFQYRQKEGSGAWESWNDIFSTTSYTVPNLTNDTEYTFQVRAVNAVGAAQLSNEATATPRADECGQSSDDVDATNCVLSLDTPKSGAIQRMSDHDWYQLEAEAGKTYQIDLEGAPNNGTLTLRDPKITSLYTVALGFGGGPIPGTYNDNISPANKDARVIWTAPRAMTVFIGVASSDRFGTGVYGTGTYMLTATETSAPAPPQQAAPDAISDLRATGFDGHVSLLWTVPASNGSAITEFEYRQKEGSGAYGGWMDVPGSGPLTSGYAVPNLTNDTKYTFQVRAVNGVGPGPGSNAASATPTDTVDPDPGPGRRPGGGGGGGGGGGPPPKPEPSDADFEWNLTRDIEPLASGNGNPTDIWSDGGTLWVLENAASGADAVYAYDLQSSERREQAEFELDRGNRFAHGIWSDSETVWVADSGQDQLFAYDLETGERRETAEFELAEANRDPRGIWSDGEAIYVLDSVNDALFVYNLESGELIAEHALDRLNRSPRGIWSDGVTIWVSDDGAKRLFAYEFDGEGLKRNEDLEFTFSSLLKAGNGDPRGIWSDGDVVYVVDAQDDRVYTYNIPGAIIAQLASLSLNELELEEFAPNRFEYAASVAHDLAATTLAVAATQEAAGVKIEPADADGDPENGHQVTLGAATVITVTVTSADGSRTKTYVVQVSKQPPCLDGLTEERLSEVTFAGGSVSELEACARSLDIGALYHHREGVYVALFLLPDLPEFLSRPFRTRFPERLPPGEPLIANRQLAVVTTPGTPGSN